MTSNKPETSGGIITLLHRIEDGILTGLLLLMIFMAVLQIFLRNIFDTGILWGDPLIRILVLWIGLIGAMVASRDDNHISIDVLSRYLPAGLKKISTLAISIFTFLVCGIMAYFSASFVLMEKADGFTAFANIPAWVCESIIPISFAIICFRYFLLSIRSLSGLMKL